MRFIVTFLEHDVFEASRIHPISPTRHRGGHGERAWEGDIVSHREEDMRGEAWGGTRGMRGEEHRGNMGGKESGSSPVVCISAKFRAFLD